MIFSKRNVIIFFRYLWLILAFSLILYILSNAIYTKRELSYTLDFSKNISKNTRGWYPESRTKYFEEQGKVLLQGEPIYYQVYLPADFDTLSVNGDIEFDEETLRLGLRQKDGSWFWQNIDNQNIDLEFPLQEVSMKSRKIELILSVPDKSNESKIYLKNDWQLNFKK